MNLSANLFPGVSALACFALPLAVHAADWRPLQEVRINGTETVVDPTPSRPFVRDAHASSAPIHTFSFVYITNDVFGPWYDEDTRYELLAGSALATGSHFGKGFYWSDCSSPGNEDFSLRIKLETTWLIHGSANNYRWSDGTAYTMARSWFRVEITPGSEDQEGEQRIRHSGTENGISPTPDSISVSYPLGVSLNWDLSGSDEWSDYEGDNPLTPITEEGIISPIAREVNNSGTDFVFADITLETRAEASIQDYAHEANSRIDIKVQQFDFTQ